MQTSQDKKETQKQAPIGIRVLVNLLLKVVIPVVIVVIALGFTKHQIDTRPQAQRKKPPRQARLVTVEPVRQESLPVMVQAMGPVIPAQEVTLMPEVSGRVISLAPTVIPGGLIKAGQVLLTIDTRDYEAVLEQRLGDLARASLNLKLEMGNQKIAQQEYDLLKQEIADEERELVLREPYLKSAKSAMQAAQAAVDKAQLDLQRCRITAPFNAVIQARHVDVGARVSQASALLTLAGTDQYWIEVKVPVSQLKWLKIPRGNELAGSHARIYDRDAWGPEHYREGRIIRLLADLETQGRLARLLVAVDNPLALQAIQQEPSLLLGSYVRVDIEGLTLKDGFPLRREWLRDGDHVWIMNADNNLEIRPVQIVYRGKETVYITESLQPGEAVVTTDMAAPVAGMPLRLDGMSAPATDTNNGQGGAHDRP